jgi:hypothetical protein
MRVEIVATNPRMGEWDKEFRNKSEIVLQKINHSEVDPEYTLHPTALFLYANDEFSLFQVVKDRPRQLAELDKDIKSLLALVDNISAESIEESVDKCFRTKLEKNFYYRYRNIILENNGSEFICVIKDNNGTNK